MCVHALHHVSVSGQYHEGPERSGGGGVACWAARSAIWPLVILGSSCTPRLMLPLCRPWAFLLGLLTLFCWRWRRRQSPCWLAGSHSLGWMPWEWLTLSTALLWALPKLRCHGAQHERLAHEWVVCRVDARSGVQRKGAPGSGSGGPHLKKQRSRCR